MAHKPKEEQFRFALDPERAKMCISLLGCAAQHMRYPVCYFFCKYIIHEISCWKVYTGPFQGLHGNQGGQLERIGPK